MTLPSASALTLPISRWSLQPGQNAQLAASYYDQYGIARQVALNWTSSNPQVASVDGSGLVVATGPGQAVGTSFLRGICGADRQRERDRRRERGRFRHVAAPRTSLNVGDQISLTAAVQNIRAKR
jgi:uncharacterized protein YjdB